MPSNSMIVAAPTRPTVGRCTRARAGGEAQGDRRGGWAEAQPLGEQRARAGDRGEVHTQPVPRSARGRVRGETARGFSDARAEASASENPKVASPTRRDDAGDGAFGSRDASSGERSGGSFVAASLPNKTFLHGPSMGVPFRSNSGGACRTRGTRAGRAWTCRAWRRRPRARAARAAPARRRSPRSWTERRSRPPCLSRLRRSGRSGSAARGARARVAGRGTGASPRGRRRRR